MNRSVRTAVCLAAIGSALALAGAAGGEAQEKVRAVILIGGHGFDRPAFDRFWGGLEGVETEVCKGEPYTAFDSIDAFKHDVVVMYNLSSGMTDAQKQNFLKLLGKGVGLVVWHHALANCQDWPEFEKIAGAKFWLKAGQREGGAQVPQSGVAFGKAKMHIEDPKHSITEGMADFEIQDEMYNRQTFVEGIKVLVTTDEPKSDKTIAWAHAYGKARVFGCQSGHDAKVWNHESFRKLMSRGIRWAANRLPEAGK